jgi:uncharacterized protein YndB with AHSA1/START domain
MTARSDREAEHERTVTIVRDFDVPARVLFRAFSSPEHLRGWLGPPGYPLTLCEVDFRVGGRFRFAMTGPDGQQMMPFGGEYLTIVPNRELSYSNAFEQQGAETMVVTLRFEEHDGRTRLTQHTVFASAAMKAAHLHRGYEGGVLAGFEQLAALVAGWGGT